MKCNKKCLDILEGFVAKWLVLRNSGPPKLFTVLAIHSSKYFNHAFRENPRNLGRYNVN